MSWWKREAQVQTQAPRPQRPLSYPVGVFVETENGDVYYIMTKTKCKVYSQRCWWTWSTHALRGSEVSLSKYLLGAPLGFRNGSLIRDVSDGKMYVISESKRRHIQTPDVFTEYGIDYESMIDVSHSEVNLHKEGEPLQ